MTSKPEQLPRVLILNAALNGPAGNTAVMLTRAAAEFAGRARMTRKAANEGTEPPLDP